MFVVPVLVEINPCERSDVFALFPSVELFLEYVDTVVFVSFPVWRVGRAWVAIVVAIARTNNAVSSLMEDRVQLFEVVGPRVDDDVMPIFFIPMIITRLLIVVKLDRCIHVLIEIPDERVYVVDDCLLLRGNVSQVNFQEPPGGFEPPCNRVEADRVVQTTLWRQVYSIRPPGFEPGLSRL